MSFLLLVFLYNSIIAETRPLWDFFLPLRTVGLHFGESRNTSYALRDFSACVYIGNFAILIAANALIVFCSYAACLKSGGLIRNCHKRGVCKLPYVKEESVINSASARWLRFSASRACLHALTALVVVFATGLLPVSAQNDATNRPPVQTGHAAVQHGRDRPERRRRPLLQDSRGQPRRRGAVSQRRQSLIRWQLV